MKRKISDLKREDLREEVKKELNLSKARKSYEYSEFMQEKVERKSTYEKLCQRVGKIIKLPLGEKESKELKQDIINAGLNVKPEEVMGLSILGLIASMMVSTFVILLTGKLISFILLPLSFYIYIYSKNYPSSVAKRRILDETSEMVLGVLYIVIYMRHTPNLEGALKFASKNLTGHLGHDFKLLLWDVQTKKTKDVFQGINEFLEKWKDKNKPFVSSMHLIMSSLHQIKDKKRKETLDMAVDTMLSGTYEQMVKYANKLRTPVQAVSLIGITLPIMGLVMLPMISAFLSDVITTEMIFFFYDLILPILVLFFINKALGERPVGFSLPDVSKHPDSPPEGKFYIKTGEEKKAIPVIIVPIIIFVISVMLYGGYIYYAQGLPPSKNDVFGSLTIVLGIALTLSSYFYLSSFQRVKLREGIEDVEDEFTNAAYILSNYLSEGKPLETSLIKTAEEMKSTKIHDFFDNIERNIKQLGMSAEEAIFNKEHGAINLYPSMLVKSIMRILVSTSEESTQAASMSMNNIGRYTKSLNKIDDKIKDILSDTISSINFQANFIAPLITGVVVGLSTMIFLILNNLSEQISSLASPDTSVGGAGNMNINFILGFLNLSSGVEVWAFQPIVGLYLVLVVALMIYLVNKIEYAGDKVYLMHRASKTLLISTLLYVVIVSVTTLLFTGLADIAVTVGSV